jgi:molybdenum cofactor synthesis domain-containing protein
MIEYARARQIVLDAVRPLPPVQLTTEAALGHVLARGVKARMQMPRFDQSAMDGIAVLVDDVATASGDSPVRLNLLGEIPAGNARRPKLEPGSAIKVFTGSALPPNAEAIVKVEDCHFAEGSVEVLRAVRAGEHIRRRGEEVRRGDLLIDSGARLTPPAIGLLTLFGIGRVRVIPAPRVGLITMGDELVAPGEPLGPAQVHDGNAPALGAALSALGVERQRRWRVGDRRQALVRAFRDALKTCDVVISCGGASVGDHDHVAEARRRCAISEKFDRVKMKPGKPNVFGLGPNGVPVFSLPGNPVSALVSFGQLVRPGLLKMMGRDTGDRILAARAGASRSRLVGRLEWMRAVLDRQTSTVTPVEAQGSHMLTGLVQANALIELAADQAGIEVGDELEVHELRWFD